MGDPRDSDPKKPAPHDGSYRRLFSHARMVEDLIRRYIGPAWIDRLDFSTLEMVPAHYVSDELEQRESDVVWRLRYGPSGEWFYVYLLIEFQSGVVRFMAIRVLSYMMLLYQDLILRKQLTRSRKLPPVLPIVLYNGTRKWTAPLQVAELIESLPGCEALLPRFEYLVIDEGHLPPEQLEPFDNPVSGVFRLEQSQGLEEIQRIIDTLIEVLDDPELRELRRDMATWLRRVVLPARLPGVEVAELHDLQEAKIMLAERAATWPKQWMAEGYESGYGSGLRETLTELIEEKFGAVDSRYVELIAAAPEARLKAWLKRILRAETVADLFES